MGRKKGRQAGEFFSKAQNAQHRIEVYVDHASEANKYRNPLLSSDLGRGHGYRNASPQSSRANGYCLNGSGDKWSSIFSRTGTSTHHAPSSNNANHRATMGLSRLRHLLEERRTEDRIYDRQHRLRLQRSRMIIHDTATSITSNDKSTKDSKSILDERHEAGWLLSHSTGNYSETLHDNEQRHDNLHATMQSTQNDRTSIEIPSLQKLAAQTLGPILPMYCAAVGSDFVGESLKSVSAGILSELAVSLAKSDWSSEGQDETIFATTDGTIFALTNSGVATGLVFRGAPMTNEEEIEIGDEEDSRWLSNEGLLALCPRILPNVDSEDSCDTSFSESSWDHWENIDFDTGLNSRMAGCFHLKRLELIDIPLQQHGTSSGISLQTLRTVLKSCTSITHLSLSGCFYNWEEMPPAGKDVQNISMLLCGNQSLPSLTHSMKRLGKFFGNGEGSMNHLIQQILFHQMFHENADDKNQISGLNRLLPELAILDLSYCSWVSPGMVITFILKCWEQTFKSTDGQSKIYQWDEEETFAGDDGIETNNSIHEIDIHQQGHNQKFADGITTTLKNLNIRGCSGLLPSEVSSSTSLPSWMEEWKGHGLFEGIDVTTERQLRR